MRGSEFVRKVTGLGRRRGVSVRIDAKRGKGSHIVLYYGACDTIVKDRRKEIGPGLLSKMIHDLGLDRSDLK